MRIDVGMRVHVGVGRGVGVPSGVSGVPCRIMVGSIWDRDSQSPGTRLRRSVVHILS
jgi:hypothetical protein